MKHYSSIIEAIKYRTHCPGCKKQLQVNDSELADERFGPAGQKIYVFYIDQRYQSTCEVDTLTSRVIINLHRTEDFLSTANPTYCSKAHVSPGYTITSGKFMHALHVECPKCHRYGFTLQVHIDLPGGIVESVLVNSEALCFDNDKVSCEIRNNYAFDKTEFTYWKRGHSKKLSNPKKMVVPIMKVNFEDPVPSFDRLKKLSLYY